MLFITDGLFVPDHGLNMSFSVAEVPSFPANGKLVWFSRTGKGRSQYKCGVIFSQKDIYRPTWSSWMEDNILKLADVQNNKILENILREGQVS